MSNCILIVIFKLFSNNRIREGNGQHVRNSSDNRINGKRSCESAKANVVLCGHRHGAQWIVHDGPLRVYVYAILWLADNNN